MSATGMWVEKYRPKEISEIVGQSEIIGSLSALIKDPTDMPHLMFSGSAGVGKTTTALCVTRQILGDNIEGNLLELNASDERGIGMVREKVKKFSGFAGLSNVPFKIIILDEADEMLRMGFIDDVEWILEQTPEKRQIALFSATMPQQIRRIATRYLKDPVQITIKDKTTTATTIRQRFWPVSGMHREKMIELIKVYGMSESDFLKYFNSAVFKSKHEKLSEILEVIAKYDYRILVGANSEIQLSAMLAELARIEN